MDTQVDKFTHKEGQYLAFIYLYVQINRRAPAESDFQRYFEVSPPTVHNMIKALTDKGLIDRKPRVPRSIRLRIDPDELPPLD